MKPTLYLKTPIPAIFNGIQDGDEPFELWTILEPIEGHPQYSTLSRRTIERAGYEPEAVSPLAINHNVQR